MGTGIKMALLAGWKEESECRVHVRAVSEVATDIVVQIFVRKAYSVSGRFPGVRF